MWFDQLMDNCKQSLEVSNKYKGVFTPIFLKFGLNIVIGILFIIGLIISITSGVLNKTWDTPEVLSVIFPIGIMAIIGYFVYIVLWGFIEVGSINLYRAALNDEKPSKYHFYEGIRRYWSRVFSGKLFIHLVFLILSPIVLILYALYIILIGIPTAGWGLVFLSTIFSALFATWTIAIVNDDMDIMGGLKQSFKVTRDNFKIMFMIVFSLSMISGYAITLFGPLGMILAGWFISGIITTYFRLVIYITYLSKTNHML